MSVMKDIVISSTISHVKLTNVSLTEKVKKKLDCFQKTR